MKPVTTHIASLLFILLTSFAAAESDPGLLIDTERTHQSFADGNADIDTVTLAPGFTLDNWSLGASLSWQHVEGNYFINSRYPNLAYVCGQLNSLSPAAKLLLLKQGKVSLQQLQYCNQTDGVNSTSTQDYSEGFNDIDFVASYYLPPLSDSVSGSLGLGYKHDNGDVSSGLGTGTRDMYIETGWLFQHGNFSLLGTAGYQFILNNSTDIEMLDYAYASLDGRWQWWHYCALGIEYQFLQANAEALDDLDYIVWYLQLGNGPGWHARLAITDYHNQTGYPDQEFSGSVSYAF